MTLFIAQEHPRETGGRFVHKPATESSVQLHAAAGSLAGAAEDARWVLDEFPDLEFQNRSGLPGERMMLHMMGDPLSADGNCEASTDAVIGLGAAELGADRLDKATILSPTGGFHCAVVAGKSGSEWVVDYTMRQFDEHADFPYVGTLDDWHRKVQDATGLPWDWASSPAPEWNWESRFFDEYRESLENPTPESRAKFAALGLLNENPYLEIMDHSAGAGKNAVTELYKMKEADTARGNCWAVTNEVIELGAKELGAEWLDGLTISGRGQHVAILAGYPEGHAVVDYTIRQFDASLPFPWTGTMEDWKETVETATGQAWDWEDGEQDAA